jgi:uncharacterized integral membrane protein (TIGR00697 family)
MGKWSIDQKTNLLLGLFVSAVVGANLLGAKITRIWIVDTSVGIFLYPLTFLITDIVQEVHGRERARQFVLVTFACVAFIALVTVFSVWLPFAPRSYVQAEQYNPVFGLSIRSFIASLTAFLMSSLHDVWSFNFWKQVTGGKWLWLRNNASSIVSQFIDTTIFMFIALYYLPWLPDILNTNPKFDVAYLFTLIGPYFGLKVLVIMSHTPFCYLGVRWLKATPRKEGAGAA